MIMNFQSLSGLISRGLKINEILNFALNFFLSQTFRISKDPLVHQEFGPIAYTRGPRVTMCHGGVF